jgi:hypothetical protein
MGQVLIRVLVARSHELHSSAAVAATTAAVAATTADAEAAASSPVAAAVGVCELY